MSSATIGELVAAGVLEFGDGYRTKRSELSDHGFRIIRVADIKEGQIMLQSPDFVGLDCTRSIGNKAGQAGDILLTTKGTVGRVAVYEGSSEPVVYSPQICYFRVRSNDVISVEYLRYWFESSEFTLQASYRKSNTDMADYINLADVRSMRIGLPGLGDQNRVVDVLSALDDKIAANRRLMCLLRETANAEFSLAVLENPVQVQLGEVAEFHNKRRAPLSANQREMMDGSVPYYGATGVFDTVDQALFDQILLLVGEDGSVVTDDGCPVTQYIWGPSWVNNHAHVLTGRGISTEMLTLAVERAQVDALVTGAVQPKLNMGNLKKLELVVPGEVAVGRLDTKIQPIFEMVRSLTEESRTLVEGRGTLLPRLMSGDLSVRNAEKAVESAL